MQQVLPSRADGAPLKMSAGKIHRFLYDKVFHFFPKSKPSCSLRRLPRRLRRSSPRVEASDVLSLRRLEERRRQRRHKNVDHRHSELEIRRRRRVGEVSVAWSRFVKDTFHFFYCMRHKF